MPNKIITYCIILFLLFFNLIIPLKSEHTSEACGLAGEKKSDEILVKFKNCAEIKTIKITQQENFNAILESCKNNPKVEYAEPDYLYHAALIPSDSYYKNQWYLQKIKTTSAWDIKNSSENIVIAILDSGVQINHPDLKDNIWVNKNEKLDGKDNDNNGFIDDINGWDFVNKTADPNPKFTGDYTESGILHGTIVAGIAAASGNNAYGVAGITWKAKIMPLKVLDDQGEGSTSNVVKSINYAVANGADIINLSFIGFGFSQSLSDAIKRAYDAGVIIVAAGGNEIGEGEGRFLDKTPMYPVCYDGVIGVAATDTIDQKTAFSGYGSKCIDISAPGISVFSASVYNPDYSIEGKKFDKYYDGYWSGTSVAVPMVSAAAALVESANPQFTRQQVISALIDQADNINKLNPNFSNQLGGRLNVFNSVNYASAELKKKSVKLAVVPASGKQSLIKISDKNGKIDYSFNIFGEFAGGANIAAGDIDGDGKDEIIAGAGQTGGPHIRIFSTAGELKGQFFAYAPNFRGGVNVAAGDVDGDGKDEIIAGAGNGGGPQVRIFNAKGKLLGQFFAYAPNFRGGVNVAAGDIDGDGKDEIIAGAGVGGGPQVRIFNAQGNIKGQFFAYDQKLRGGVKIAVADFAGGTRKRSKSIVTAPSKGASPEIKIFDNHGIAAKKFLAYEKKFFGGVNIAAGDMDNDGFDEIITGAGQSGGPHVRVFKENGSIIGSFYAFESDFAGGVNVAAITMKK